MNRAAGIALLLALCCGCGDDDGRTTLRFWAMGREGEVVTELLQGFYKEQPDVPVRVEQLPWSCLLYTSPSPRD